MSQVSMKAALVIKEPTDMIRNMASVISPYDTIQFDAPARCSCTRQRFCYTSAPTTFSYSLQLQLAVEHWFFGLDLRGMKDVWGKGKKLFALTIILRFMTLSFSI